MKELAFVHPGYETRGVGDPTRFPTAHRVVRMAFSVGGVIDVPLELYADALNAFERVANDSNADERRYTTKEVALLAELFDRIRTELDASLDDQERPRASGGDTIMREAMRPMTLEDGEHDDDRVFQLEADGRIGTVYPRMSLPDFRDRLACCSRACGPDYMWARRTAGHLEVAGLSARADAFFAMTLVDAVREPLFDRYYYAPAESSSDRDDRALAFSLAIMVAEWATGRFPYQYKFHDNGPLSGKHLKLALPKPLARILSSAMQIDRNKRPRLSELVDALAAQDPHRG